MKTILERYAKQIRGVIRCFDRVLLQGSLPGVGFPSGMQGFLTRQGTRVFDFAEFSKPLTEQLRAIARTLADDHGLKIEHANRRTFDKEAYVAKVPAERGDHPGLVSIISAMEVCSTYEARIDPKTKKPVLRRDNGKCIHYYYYFIAPDLGLCHLRVSTWAPFRLQFYFNAHNWLARQLEAKGIGFKQVDNPFVDIDNFDAAQKIADAFDVRRLHQILDFDVAHFCPIASVFNCTYHWGLMQIEYATDIVFKSRNALQDLYQPLIRVAVQAVKADDVMLFFGRKRLAAFQGELETSLRTREMGTRIKHRLGRSSITAYDKFGVVLRIETTTNDVSEFKQYRRVVQRDGQVRFKNAPVPTNIYSLNPIMKDLLGAANQRYLLFLSTLHTPTAGIKALRKISEPVRNQHRPYKGFNLFLGSDQLVFESLARGEFAISGFRNRHLGALLPGISTSQASRLLKRLRLHGLIKRVPGSFKYYPTTLGRGATAAALAVKQLALLPAVDLAMLAK
ncbi:MAG TPA: MarR family transcriptional regulator [Myxococcales bacterium]|jgi:hypothetical protein|nr:MarR family transcriptional regulator [Myxococcales bacterium]